MLWGILAVDLLENFRGKRKKEKPAPNIVPSKNIIEI
jgi:hypothetical protein